MPTEGLPLLPHRRRSQSYGVSAQRQEQATRMFKRYKGQGKNVALMPINGV